ncbi:MAG: glycosyltransferase family 39 protein [Janthinobacterium lividum]
MKKRNYLYVAAVAGVLLLGVLIRVMHFPGLPPGFNQDEAASAYESYALAETGHDKWGNLLPAYFPAWGSGQNVLLAYLLVPVIKVFGLSIFSARLVPLGLGLLTLPLLFYCLRPAGRWPALLATLLLALAPWHFMQSRWALESNLVPFFMLLGCTLLSRALITQRRCWILPALVPFALSLYAYGTTVLVLPGLLGLVGALGWRQLLPHWRSWLVALGLFLLLAAPFLLFFTENYLLGRNLAWTDGLFFATPLLPATRASQVAGAPLADLLAHNLRFLVAGCDDGTSYNVLAGFKPLLSPALPFALVAVLVGLWQLVRQRGQVFYSAHNIVLVVLAAWGVAACALFFTIDLNVNRFNHFYVPCLALAAWAMAATISSFQPSVPRPLLRLAVVGWLMLEGGLAVRSYFTTYAQGPIRSDFNEGLGEAFGAVAGLWGLNQVRITTQMPLPYVYALFYLRYPPAQFQREARVRVVDGTYQVRRFGRYIFTDDELVAGQPYAYLARKGELADTAERHREVVFTNDSWEVGIMQPGAAARP